MPKKIEIDAYTVIHRILKNPDFENVECLRSIMNEARVLEAVKAPMHLWLNLGRKTYDEIDDNKIAEIKTSNGYIIKKERSSKLNRCMHLVTSNNETLQTRQAVALALSSNIHLMIYRDANSTHITAFS